MLRSREHASFSEAGMLDRKKGLPEVVFVGFLWVGFFFLRAALYIFSGAIAVLRGVKESRSNAHRLFTELEGWLPNCRTGSARDFALFL